jgi:hypothetical protein
VKSRRTSGRVFIPSSASSALAASTILVAGLFELVDRTGAQKLLAFRLRPASKDQRQIIFNEINRIPIA